MTDRLDVRAATEALVAQVGRIVLGRRSVVEQIFGALLADGHVLLDDVPGVGKTTLARAVARSLDLTFRRIQCTPDLVPGDVTGVSIYEPRGGGFTYRPGPLQANVVLVDEIKWTASILPICPARSAVHGPPGGRRHRATLARGPWHGFCTGAS